MGAGGGGGADGLHSKCYFRRVGCLKLSVGFVIGFIGMISLLLVAVLMLTGGGGGY